MMDLYREILVRALKDGEIKVTFQNEETNVSEFVEGVCCRALREIKTVIQDDSLTDPECFLKIEEIISVLERVGSGGGGRHDFG